MDDQSALVGRRGLYSRVIDSALLIAVVLAVLQFSGWTYRLAYLKRFSIDPSSLNSSNIAIAVEGLTAIMLTFVAWAIASLTLIVVAVVAWIFIRWVERRRGNTGPIADRTAIVMIQAGGTAIAIMILLAGGSIAGREAAEDRIANVQQGQVWTYHLDRETLSGVPIAQSETTMWLLTKAGVRLIRVGDIRLIDGPLFTKLTAKA